MIRDRSYAIRLYEPGTLSALVEGSGFADARVQCDFRPHRLEGDFGFMNHRMVATARKSN
jgi:hypothetical protein